MVLTHSSQIATMPLLMSDPGLAFQGTIFALHDNLPFITSRMPLAAARWPTSVIAGRNGTRGW